MLSLAVPPALVAAPSTQSLEGHWQGTLQGMLRLVINIDRGPTGGLKGTMDSPDQGAMGLPIDTLIVSSDSLGFVMASIMGSYAGAVSPGRDKIAGVWRQAGMVLPLDLQRVDKPLKPNRPQEPQRPFPYDTVAVRFDNPRAAGVTLAGTLTVPRGKGPFPVALLITGSGPEDRDEMVFGHRPFLVLADHLTRHGIAVLRLDDRGVGGSTGSFSRATSEDFASDIVAGIGFLKTRKEVDARKIGLVGHSEGGLIAPMVVAQSKDVAYVVLMAGPGVPGDSILALQSVAMQRSMGVSDAAIDRQMVHARRMNALIREGDSAGAAAAGRELVKLQLEALPEAQRKALGDPDSVVAGAIRRLDTPWMRFFIGYDPRPALRGMKCPVLAINGGRDIQVPPNENLAAIREALAGNRDVRVKELPGLNHLFQTCTTCTIGEYPLLEETMAPAALDEMSNWILAHTTAAR
jgi:pimeloyl-ACP methyl ester carboxylesterase